MEDRHNIIAALKRYRSNQHTKKDFELLRSCIDTDRETELVSLILSELDEKQTYPIDPKVVDLLVRTDQVIVQIVQSEKQHQSKIRRFANMRWIAAVAAMLLIVIGVSFYFLRTEKQDPQEDKWMSHDFAPAGNRATLTLEDGTVINLDKLESGVLTEHDGLRITKDDNGMITYELDDAGLILGKEQFNTLVTPKGGQYQIKLSDGTKVRLNAVSSLRYPRTFSDSKREVEVEGEAYFEVAKDNKRPFIVLSDEQRIKVYGTEFNINTYDDPGVIRTTLIEGSIEVSGEQGHLMLSPGQQSVFKRNSIQIVPVNNMLQTIAWMKGEFYFDGANIKEIMSQLERWYDIEVEYKTLIQHSFVAKIQRDVHLSEFLKILEKTGLVSFEIDGRKITVSPPPIK